QSMQTGNDNGTFGFSSGRYGGRYFSYTFYGGDGSGFAQNAGAGINYNYYDKKIKFNAGYFYTRNYTYSDQFSNRETFLPDSTFFRRIDTAENDNVRNNHNFSTRLEYDIDSSNNIVIRADLNYTLTSIENARIQRFQTADFFDINLNSLHNKGKNENFNLNTLAIYTHKFKKKGRIFAISGNYIFSDGRSLDDINNVNTFLTLSPNEQMKLIVKNNEKANTHTAKSSLLYVEPLNKMFTLQGFYNFSTAWRTNSNNSQDEHANSIDSLWLVYKNNYMLNRAGSSLNFAYNGVNMQVGIAYQNMALNGNSFLIAEKQTKSFSYHSFIPYFDANFELPHDFDIDLSYSYSVEEPSMSYLFPMPDLTNNLYKTLGNPELKPERSHEVEARLGYWNQAAMANFSLNGSADFYDSQIVYNQTTEFMDSIGYVTVSKPENVKGGDHYSLYLWSNFPIVKTILTMNISLNGSIRRSPIFINAVENITSTQSTGGRIGFNITAGQKLSFYASGNISASFTQYSIQIDRNQNYLNGSANVGFKWQVFKKTFLEGSYNFSNYSNKKLDFNQNIHNLNVSIRQVLGKKNQFELRLAGIDLLNQNQYIRQIASTNYIEYYISPTLARYFLLTFAYNLRGFDLNNRGRGYF
ncbi:MAG: outer membrane beta-barrel family protein, partial [Bacteroidales bacterium]|nr:outer membrane beta-barrel family protein [Bacteroidales bacterium]